MSKAKDFFQDEDEFESLLSAAESNAAGVREEEFVAGIRDKYDEWGMGMYLSDAQHSWLTRIAEE